MTPAGREANRVASGRYGVGPFDSWSDADTGERCLTDGLPFVPLQGYNMNYHILQAPGWVAILNEMFHEYRLIPIDDRPHTGASHRTVARRRAGTVGGRTLWSSRPRTSPTRVT